MLSMRDSLYNMTLVKHNIIRSISSRIRYFYNYNQLCLYNLVALQVSGLYNVFLSAKKEELSFVHC